MDANDNVNEVRLTSSTGGQKGQKPARFDLISSRFLWLLATVCGYGGRKYDDDNWTKGYSWRLSYGALQRHLHLFWMGEDIDKESGLHHLGHAAWHCMVLFVFSTGERYKSFDDRLQGALRKDGAKCIFKEYNAALKAARAVDASMKTQAVPSLPEDRPVPGEPQGFDTAASPKGEVYKHSSRTFSRRRKDDVARKR